MQSIRVRVLFKLDFALIPSVWIPFRGNQVCVAVKYEQLPHFCYYCGLIK